MEEYMTHMTPKAVSGNARFWKPATTSSFIRLSGQQQNWVLLT
jgi:hypothetical protein